MKVYISNYLSKSISILNYPNFDLEKEIELEEDIYPQHFCVDKDKNLMYIPGTSDGIIYILDLEKDKIIDNISIGGSLTQIALFNGELFVSNEDSNSIYILDKDTANPIGVIEVDEMPHRFDFDEKNSKLYVSCINSIVCIDTLSKCIYKKVDTEFKMWNVNIDKEKREIYTLTLDGKLIILDEETMSVINVLEEFLLPIQICFDYSHNKVYVVDLGYRNVRVLEYSTGKYLRNIEINGDPQGLQISNDEKLLFVSDGQKNSIKIYDTSNYLLIKEVKVGKEPTTIVCV
ncbi:YncE family protein [Romboutsia sp.]|uniref:YncE family protein n=1 Tax=Romboutsia sp. TaxID=1965302 RepID=UPI003F37AB69